MFLLTVITRLDYKLREGAGERYMLIFLGFPRLHQTMVERLRIEGFLKMVTGHTG